MGIIKIGQKGNQLQAPIQSSLLIGLGGTGKQVLLQLRRKFFERYGIKGFPVMSYLWIDTDTQNIGLDNQELDYLLQEVMMDEDERVDCQVPQAQFDNYFTMKNAYKHIWRWLYPSLQAYGAILNGAGQLRPKGRLAFFHKFSEIRKKITDMAANVQNVNNVSSMQNYSRNEVISDPIHVYLVSSLAGGTGCGMFLDCGFLVKHLLPNADVSGFFLLPSAFSHDVQDEIYANAYAALKELEFYSLRKDFLVAGEAKGDQAKGSYHDFDVEWEPGVPGSPVMGPPFNTCYLVDNKTELGASFSPDDKIEICDMIAENIFMDFVGSSAFGPMKRSIRSNLEQNLINYYDYQYADEAGKIVYNDTYSLRYSAFGLSRIYIPVYRIRNACTYKLCIDLTDFWLRKNPPPGDLRSRVEHEVMKTIGAPSNQAVLDKLGISDSAKTRIEDVIGNWITSEKRKNLDRTKVISAQFYKKMSEDRAEFLKKNFSRPGENPKEWGDFVVRILRHNCDSLVAELKANLLMEVNRWLDRYDIRIECAVKYLEAVHNIFKDSQDKSRKLRAAHDEKGRLSGGLEFKIKGTEELVNKKFEILSEVESTFKRWLRKSTLRTLIGQAYDLQKDHYNQLRQILILETADRVYQSLMDYIGAESRIEAKNGEIKTERSGLIKELRDLESILSKQLKPSLERKFQSYNRVVQEKLNENLYEQDMFKKYYRFEGQEIEERGELNKGVAEKIEEGLFQKMDTSLFGLLKRFREEGVPHVEEEVVKFCSEKFDEIIVQDEALQRFYEHYADPAERKVHFNREVQHGSAWMKKGTHFMGVGGAGSFESNVEKVVSIGLYNGKHSNYDDFKKNILNAGMPASSNIGFPNVDKDEVIIYSEWAGLPLMYISGLDEYKRQAYIPWSTQNRELHIDCHDDKYVDILIKHPSDLSLYLESHKTLLIGSMLRVVEVEEVNGMHLFKFVDRSIPGVVNEVPLGKEYVAIETLKKESSLRTKFRDQITKIELGLNVNKLLEYFTLLTYYYQSIFPLKYKYAGATPIQIQSLENRVLAEKVHEVLEKLHDRELSDDQISQSRNNLMNNLDGFSRTVGSSGRRVLKT
jgi:hypothetical protein